MPRTPWHVPDIKSFDFDQVHTFSLRVLRPQVFAEDMVFRNDAQEAKHYQRWAQYLFGFSEELLERLKKHKALGNQDADAANPKPTATQLESKVKSQGERLQHLEGVVNKLVLPLLVTKPRPTSTLAETPARTCPKSPWSATVDTSSTVTPDINQANTPNSTAVSTPILTPSTTAASTPTLGPSAVMAAIPTPGIPPVNLTTDATTAPTGTTATPITIPITTSNARQPAHDPVTCQGHSEVDDIFSSRESSPASNRPLPTTSTYQKFGLGLIIKPSDTPKTTSHHQKKTYSQQTPPFTTAMYTVTQYTTITQIHPLPLPPLPPRFISLDYDNILLYRRRVVYIMCMSQMSRPDISCGVRESYYRGWADYWYHYTEAACARLRQREQEGRRLAVGKLPESEKAEKEEEWGENKGEEEKWEDKWEDEETEVEEAGKEETDEEEEEEEEDGWASSPPKGRESEEKNEPPRDLAKVNEDLTRRFNQHKNKPKMPGGW
ncbi:hypothetical protein QBC40DRAFT_321065 [Triangularia verruculosa]|uniref:Uncharacterized protein n=1 Tax=Triangularia verruculosa TaxID=2587418 RepID=A0AAN7AWZ9_9PEZI|nr:hypothetical protein QBC40DRAFT_321065 [Triangularia verruculosa]